MPQIIDPNKFNSGVEDIGPPQADNLTGAVNSNIEHYRDTHSLKKNQPYIIDLVSFERLHFQTIPERVDCSSESSFASLESPGRNNPLYHYTGSEDIIKFIITWFGNDISKQDVIRKCRWLQTLTRVDGYKGSIHPVKFIFGEMFKNSKWIVTEAPFQIGLFDREAGMYPMRAEQNVTLRKISLINTERGELLNPSY